MKRTLYPTFNQFINEAFSDNFDYKPITKNKSSDEIVKIEARERDVDQNPQTRQLLDLYDQLVKEYDNADKQEKHFKSVKSAADTQLREKFSEIFDTIYKYQTRIVETKNTIVQMAKNTEPSTETKKVTNYEKVIEELRKLITVKFPKVEEYIQQAIDACTEEITSTKDERVGSFSVKGTSYGRGWTTRYRDELDPHQNHPNQVATLRGERVEESFSGVKKGILVFIDRIKRILDGMFSDIDRTLERIYDMIP